MMRNKLAVVGMVLLAVTAATFAQAPAASEQGLDKIIEQASAALVRVDFQIKNDLVTQDGVGQAYCVDAAAKIFMTRDIPADVPQDELTNITLTPAKSDVKITAKLLSLDPQEGIAFLKASSGEWKQLDKASGANLPLGQKVVSVGLLGPTTGNEPYLSVAMVSARLRLPGQLYYVSGGTLTVSSSPVMTLDGKVIGLVGGQIPIEYEMVVAGGRSAPVGLIGRQQTSFFTPIDEFEHVMKFIDKPRPLAWMGVVNYMPLGADDPARGEIGKDKPAVLVGNIVPKTAADNAKLVQGDIITEVNGKGLEKLANAQLVVAAFDRDMKRKAPGDKVSLTVYHKDKTTSKVDVTLDPIPTRPTDMPRYYDKALGFAARDVTEPERYSRTKPVLDKGVVLMFVVQDGPMAKADLRPGEFVIAVNDKGVDSVTALKAELAKAKSGAPITFMILREDKPTPVVVTPRTEMPGK
jgi:S1-C subfamily serine protease